MVDVLVTTAGGIEEDLIKCMGPTLLGEFTLEGHKLRKSGLNRIGNLLLPNANYCTFEDFLMPILDECLEEQTRDHVLWTPSKLIRKLGQKINHPESIYYWASKNDIPVFSPALTDGSIGDMMYFHSIKSPGLLLDIIQDIRLLNEGAVRSTMTGVLLLGGGLPKHHIFNANLMVRTKACFQNGRRLDANYFITTVVFVFYRETEPILPSSSTLETSLRAVTLGPVQMKQCLGGSLKPPQSPLRSMERHLFCFP